MAQATGPALAVRELPPNDPAIIRATDLGGVQVLKSSDLFLLSDAFGDVRPDTRGLGLYAGDTRVVSCLAMRVNGARPVLLRTSSGDNSRGLIQMTNADPETGFDPATDPGRVRLARHALGISRERIVAGGLRERVTVANFTQQREHVVVDLDIDVDDADTFEVRGREREIRGHHLPILVSSDGRVTFRYNGLDNLTRWTFVAAGNPDSIEPAPKESDAAVKVHWERDVEPGAQFSLDWQVWTDLSKEWDRSQGNEPPAIEFPFTLQGLAQAEQTPGAEPGTETKVSSDNELFDMVIRRSLADLSLLTTDGPNSGERYVAAGIPWYATLFGRDALITGFQTLAFRPSIAVEALETLAARQATRVDEWRDAQPGKILHELRTGEMARTNEIPFTPYYGTVDATPLWLILLSEVYDWTGDRALVDRLWPHALAALRWIDEFGTNADGFVTYERKSSQGLVNQGWKDSAESNLDHTGAMVEAPIALVEVQGYVYDARLRLARLARLRGDEKLARRLEKEAEVLRSRFERAFWMADQHYYAMSIGKNGHLADTITSNPAQCLWTGIVSPERAGEILKRISAPDMDSGWGVRTFASGQAGYNPIGYHNGTIWPHDNALIVAGLKRYGYHDPANAIAGKIFEAAQTFDDYRLPELYCGFPRTTSDPPVPYPVACSPQAWSAGSSLQLLTCMLGLHANTEKRELELRQPRLPSWLSEVRILNLCLGEASLDLLFHNWRGSTSAEVLRKRGDVAVTIRV